MARITILGGTGYTGVSLVAEAATRGHEVTSLSRTAPATPVAGVSYTTGSILDDALVQSLVKDADVVIAAVPPRGDLPGKIRPFAASLTETAAAHGTRYGFIGGAGSLLATQDGPRLVDLDFPEAYRAEALEAAAVLDDLRATETAVDWFYVSPAAGYGAYAPGEATGTYRLGGDVLLADAEGTSYISSQDLAKAVIDEVEEPAHRNTRFTVAY